MIRIYVIDHRDDDCQPPGKIIRPFLIQAGQQPGPEYTDYCALYETWYMGNQSHLMPDIVGFFGYRKYMVFDPIDEATPAHNLCWWQCKKAAFDKYRTWMARWDGGEIKRLLTQYDILQAAPYHLNTDIWADFKHSRSIRDGSICEEVTERAFKTAHAVRIYPYLFITRWSVFDRMMREMEPIRLELHGKGLGGEGVNEDYKKRPMAYVMERVYSLWLENSGLDVKELSLLHCWEMQK